MTIFSELESSVQSYARKFPALFDRAVGATLFDANGREYLDFLAGAGALNYGHNHPVLKSALLEYLQADRITHGLDLHTSAKAEFLNKFKAHILLPRNMDYRVQFTGPTGTNAVEAALKLARKATGRQNIVCFTNGFHGVSLGSLAATGNETLRAAAGIPMPGTVRMPYDNYFGEATNTAVWLEKLVSDHSSGLELPAAIILETVQGEGGLNVASKEWLIDLQNVCRRHDILLIVDDIQAGCGRTGTFFSFEPFGLDPDIVTLSKSLSGYGLPLAVLLHKPRLDIWSPGEHSGTFRGNNHAFITAAAALEHFWHNPDFQEEITYKGVYVTERLQSMAGQFDFKVKGRGMMQGIEGPSTEMVNDIVNLAFKEGLIIETGGPDDRVLKCFAPLTISHDELKTGLDILEAAIQAAIR